VDLDPQTVKDIQAILGRDCVIEVTVAFYDNSEDALEPTDIGATLELDAGTPAAEQREQFGEMLDSLRSLFARLAP
jgi:hypothetical protein